MASTAVDPNKLENNTTSNNEANVANEQLRNNPEVNSSATDTSASNGKSARKSARERIGDYWKHRPGSQARRDEAAAAAAKETGDRFRLAYEAEFGGLRDSLTSEVADLEKQLAQLDNQRKKAKAPMAKINSEFQKETAEISVKRNEYLKSLVAAEREKQAKMDYDLRVKLERMGPKSPEGLQARAQRDAELKKLNDELQAAANEKFPAPPRPPRNPTVTAALAKIDRQAKPLQEVLSDRQQRLHAIGEADAALNLAEGKESLGEQADRVNEQIEQFIAYMLQSPTKSTEFKRAIGGRVDMTKDKLPQHRIDEFAKAVRPNVENDEWFGPEFDRSYQELSEAIFLKANSIVHSRNSRDQRAFAEYKAGAAIYGYIGARVGYQNFFTQEWLNEGRSGNDRLGAPTVRFSSEKLAEMKADNSEGPQPPKPESPRPSPSRPVPTGPQRPSGDLGL